METLPTKNRFERSKTYPGTEGAISITLKSGTIKSSALIGRRGSLPAIDGDEEWVAPLGLGKFEFIRGNALVAEEFPDVPFDFVVSTGLGEFLKADEIAILYRNVHRVLAPGGVFYTSATRYEKRSESFLKTFELLTQYRTIDYLDCAVRQTPMAKP